MAYRTLSKYPDQKKLSCEVYIALLSNNEYIEFLTLMKITSVFIGILKYYYGKISLRNDSIRTFSFFDKDGLWWRAIFQYNCY